MAAFEAADMETYQVYIADAFASEPLGGVPVAMFPDGAGLIPEQLRKVATEFGTLGCVRTTGEDTLQYVGREPGRGVITGAIAGGQICADRGVIESTQTIPFETATSDASDGDGTSDPTRFDIDCGEDGRPALELAGRSLAEPELDLGAVIDALHLPTEPDDYGELTLPVSRVSGFEGTLLAPVPYQSDLAAVDPVTANLSSLLDTADAARLVLYTFDTIEGAHDVHARIFDPRASANEVPASGAATGACGAYFSRYDAFDADRDEVVIESGYYLDRPAVSSTSLTATPRVSGGAVTVLDGSVLVPPSDDDDIIVA